MLMTQPQQPALLSLLYFNDNSMDEESISLLGAVCATMYVCISE